MASGRAISTSRASTSVRHPAGDEVEQRLELDLGRERRADLVEALELAEPAGGGLVQARVLDRDGGLRGQQMRELLVLGGEVPALRLLGQVEVAVGDPAQHDRDAEERAHRRVVPRESDRTRVVRDVVHPERSRIHDQDAEQPTAARQVADRLLGLHVDPRRVEGFEAATGTVDHAERRVPRLGEVGGRLDDVLQQGVERQLRVERDPGVDQPSKPPLLCRRLRDGRLLHALFLAAATPGQRPRHGLARRYRAELAGQGAALATDDRSRGSSPQAATSSSSRVTTPNSRPRCAA